MKRFYIILLILCLLIIPTSCKKENINTESIASEVTINLPKDNTVNGYRTEAHKNTNGEMPDSIDTNDVVVGDINSQVSAISKDYCGNKNSMVFHKSSCGSVTAMNESNKYYSDRETLISEGYKPCGNCKP